MLKGSLRSSGPRGKSNGRGGHSRGGIGKARSSPAPRTDRDGDVDMAGPGRGRGGRGGRGRGSQSSKDAQPNDRRKSGRPTRNPFDNVTRLQQAIAKGINSGDAVVHNGKNQKQPRDHIHVRGWDKSRAASNSGGCINSLKDFIERKASRLENSRRAIKLTSTKVAGDTLILFLSPEDAETVLHLNGFSFAGADLIIEKKEKDETNAKTQTKNKQEKKPEEEGMSGSELRDRMKAMLDRRYNAELKLLDLSVLGTDPEFANTGILSNKERQFKFVAALMKVASQEFKSTAQKREAVKSITLAGNGLPDVAPVTSVAQTFPDIVNLDLSNNDFKSTNALRPWSRRFKQLDMLILSNNPVEGLQPDFHQDITKWFKTLRMLNNVQVRTEEEAAASRERVRLPPVILPQNFNDAGGIGESFVKHFFPLFDNDRTGLARQFYDAESTFSLNVNTKAPHSDEFKKAPWGDTIKKSRNLIKITTLPGRMERKFKGPDAIVKAWLELPITRHPDLITEGERYCIECETIPEVPDPSGQSAQGVGGLMIIVHGQLGEFNAQSGEITAMRSFDRTFVLGPGGGLGGIRVVSDICTLRAYGGIDAWIPSQVNQVIQGADSGAAPLSVAQPIQGQGVQGVQPVQPMPNQVLPAVDPQQAQVQQMLASLPGMPQGFAQREPGKSDEQLQKEFLTLQVAAQTRLTLSYAHMCLENSGWNVESAIVSFEQVKGTLPADAFV